MGGFVNSRAVAVDLARRGLAEEDYVVPRDALRRWIVDPLDGTSNSIRHLPWFCVGIALATANDIERSVVCLLPSGGMCRVPARLERFVRMASGLEDEAHRLW